MTWPVEDVAGLGPSFILKGKGSDHAPRACTPESHDGAARQRRRVNNAAKAARRAAAGLCGSCGKNEPKPGCRTCLACIDRSSAAIEKLREAREPGVCSSCARRWPPPGRKTCEACREAVRKCKERRAAAKGG